MLLTLKYKKMRELHNKKSTLSLGVCLRRWNGQFGFPSGVVNCEFYIGGGLTQYPVTGRRDTRNIKA